MVFTPKSRFGFWLFAWMLLPPGWAAAQVTHVVHVSLDGLGSVYLQNYLSNGPTHLPNFVRLVNEGPISQVVDTLLQNLTNDSPRTYSFVHLREPDITGHGSGWGSPAYSNAVVLVDRQLARIFSAIDGNPILSGHTVLIVSADHGGGGEGPGSHSRPEFPVNYTIPFFVWGPPVPAAADVYTLFTNRRDPGTNRVEYQVTPRPIRNGDAGNLALAYLGLPSIPGSFMIPALAGRTLLVQRERDASGDEIIKVSWRISGEQFLLQWTDSLQPPVNWRSIDIFHLTEENGYFCYRWPAGSVALKFFRLRRSE